MRHWIIGIDEVGRGPLAGPVTLGAFALPRLIKKTGLITRAGVRLRDSKQLSLAERLSWDTYLRKDFSHCFSLVSLSSRLIDRAGIAPMLVRGAVFVLKSLVLKLPSADSFSVYLDGSLFLPGQVRSGDFQRLSIKFRDTPLSFNVKTVIKGDELIPSISLASIIAKVHRDRLMGVYAGRFPGYGFETNMGYGTARHLAALRSLGPSAIHRLTFISKYLKVS